MIKLLICIELHRNTNNKRVILLIEFGINKQEPSYN